jgi:hypothetical protein
VGFPDWPFWNWPGFGVGAAGAVEGSVRRPASVTSEAWIDMAHLKNVEMQNMSFMD